MSEAMTHEQTNTGPPIVARAGRYYRNTRYLIFVLFMGFGLWCARDGFFLWPKENAAAAAQNTKLPHTEVDVKLNQGLAILLPPFALLVLIRTLYNSRGAYRLDGDTLHIPGHEPIPLSAIRRIDKRLWDRKGIAYIDYEAGGADSLKRFRLDDFVYERGPTDQIFERIEEHARGFAEQAG